MASPSEGSTTPSESTSRQFSSLFALFNEYHEHLFCPDRTIRRLVRQALCEEVCEHVDYYVDHVFSGDEDCRAMEELDPAPVIETSSLWEAPFILRQIIGLISSEDCCHGNKEQAVEYLTSKSHSIMGGQMLDEEGIIWG